MRRVRALRKHWKPFRDHVRQHERTCREWGRTIVCAGFAAGLLIDDRWQAFAMLAALWLVLYVASVWHWISCYRYFLRPGDDDSQKPPPPEDRYELIDGRETFRRYPWLPK